ncbi:hypothetical protein CVT26_010804 [Gymnopilus dilepis]|uniref:Uncharacterized protein n=1 Tax=Gymnopilus dilepis TaxID=231916 RepID=A0A409VIG5_9AGAR|nr:hypothetical protein CVT26_010804 [Gymnopilus dilepis]
MSQFQEQSTKRKRKIPKRYLQSPDGDDRAAVPDSASQASMPHAAPSRPRRQSTAESTPTSVAEVEVDVLNEPDDGRLETESRHSEYSPKVRTMLAIPESSRASKSNLRTASDAPPPRKKPRKVVVSESEDDEYMEGVPDPAPEYEDDDDYLSPEEKMSSKVSKGKLKAISGKSVAGPKSTKRKAKSDLDDFQPSPIEKKGTAKSSTIPRKRLKPSGKADELFVDVVGDVTGTPELPASSPAPAKQDSPAPIVPKKPKLPTIRKTKLPGTPGLATPTSTPAKKLPLEVAPTNKEGLANRKNILAGNTDIDLSNKSIYQELFSKSGGTDGATPRRAKEEERRKELNRMRDEARLKRAAEAAHFFDLQAQFEKISRFEERLRAERSSALYPNFLAAKWREVYERDRRRPKEQEWNGPADAANAKEEGEVG